MKCQNCGAEVPENSKVCEYCGSQISLEMRKEQEQINKVGCPKCSSTNISFAREKQGEIKGKRGNTIVHTTVGFCKDCGCTWNVMGSSNKPQSSKMVWWVLGWIFFFPAPIMVLIWRKKNTWDIKVKIAVTIVFWILFFILGATGEKDESPKAIERENDIVVQESNIYDDTEVMDVMNGTRSKKIGEYALLKLDSKECTEENLADIYYNYFLQNDFNWMTILYTDQKDDSGVYINQLTICKDVFFEKDEYGDYSLCSSEDEILYVPSGDNKTLTKVEEDK